MSTIVQKHQSLLLIIGASIAVVLSAIGNIIQANIGEATLWDGVRAIIFLSAVAVVIPVIGYSLGGIGRLVTYAFPVVFFFFFEFSNFYGFGILMGLNESAATMVGLGILLSIGFVSMALIRKRNPNSVSALFFFIASGSAVIAMSNVFLNSPQSNPNADAVVDSLTTLSPKLNLEPSSSLPDIIYIIPDRYPSAQTFTASFDSENRPFLTALQNRNFYVAPNARANYPKTFQSLASSLNMTDLAPLIDIIGTNSTNRQPLFKMIENNVVQNSLRSQGYSFTFLGNWWQQVRENRNADINFYGAEGFLSHLSEFETTLLLQTPFGQKLRKYQNVVGPECLRLKHQLNFLKSVRRNSNAPSFILAHLTIPHAPITMDREGNCLPPILFQSGDDWSAYQRAYRDYVEYLNGELLEIFDANNAIDNGRDLVFVIQSDEGPYPQRLHLDAGLNMHNFTPREMKMKFGIINAIYWDAGKYGNPYLTQTPINNWRIIFSEIFGHPTALIQDERSFVFKDESHIYDLRDVTETLTKTSSYGNSSPALHIENGQPPM